MSTTQTAAESATVELAREFLPRVSRIVRMVSRETSDVSRTQMSVLASLRDAGPLRITELAENEHVTQPAMTALVSRLEERGWAERQKDAADGRVVNVAITPAGRDAVGRLSGAAAEALATRLARLDDGERALLEASLPILDALVET